MGLDPFMEQRPLKQKRCLVIADGFFEWVTEGAARDPQRITLKDNGVFAFAGLWDHWKDPAGVEIRTFPIITTASENHPLMRPIHERMPVILNKEEEDRWLSSDPDHPENVLRQYPADLMSSYKISKLVNSPRNDTPACIEPAP